MSTISSDWDAMCTLFLKNSERFSLAVDPHSSEVEIFRRVYENGYVRTLVGQWLTTLPAVGTPPAQDDSTEKQSEVMQPIKNAEPQLDMNTLTTEVHSDTVGRYVVVAANTQIPPNAAIISEPAFALVPVYAPHYKPAVDRPKCSTCADWRTLDALRCRHCARISYCGDECRRRAAASISGDPHAFECAGHRMGLFESLGVSHLAVRALLVGAGELDAVCLVTTDGGLDAWWRRMQLAVEDEVTKTRIGYARVLRLATNFAKTAAEDLVRYALTAAMFTMYLRDCTEFFATSTYAGRLAKATVATDAEVLVGALILRHMGQIINNAHTICGLVVQSPPGGGEPLADSANSAAIPLGHLHDHVQVDVVATALYPRIAILNHSCAPNIRNRFDGDRLTICATRALDAGAEVFNSYCSMDALLGAAERRTLLSAQYGFECTCERCAQQGDEGANAAGCEDTYICVGCGGRVGTPLAQALWWRQHDRPTEALKCAKCERHVDLEWYDRFMMMFEREAKGSQQRKWLAEDTCRLYAECATFLVEGHYLRLDMASMVVKLFPIGELELNGNDAGLIDLMLPVAADYAVGTKQQFGGMSLEHIEAAGIYLDLLALRKRLFKTRADTTYAAEIVSVVRMCASAQVQAIYAQYFEDYIL